MITIESINVRGESGKTYTVKAHADGSIHCSCPAWKFQNKPAQDRTCKHIKHVMAQFVGAA